MWFAFFKIEKNESLWVMKINEKKNSTSIENYGFFHQHSDMEKWKQSFFIQISIRKLIWIKKIIHIPTQCKWQNMRNVTALFIFQ